MKPGSPGSPVNQAKRRKLEKLKVEADIEGMRLSKMKVDTEYSCVSMEIDTPDKVKKELVMRKHLEVRGLEGATRSDSIQFLSGLWKWIIHPALPICGLRTCACQLNDERQLQGCESSGGGVPSEVRGGGMGVREGRQTGWRP